MQTIYTSPDQAPSGMQAVIDCLNSSNDLSFEVVDTPGLRNAFRRHFSAGNESLMSVTPDPRVSISWHRNTVDSTSPVVIEMAEIVKDHYGNNVGIVTGWSMGSDGRTHASRARR